MDSVTITDAVHGLRDEIGSFVELLETRLPRSEVTDVVEHGATVTSGQLGQQPERCTEDHLIWGILSTLGYSVTPRPHYPAGDDDDYPDFRVDNLSDVVIGENKSINKYGAAKADLQAYLDSARYDYGIATDGLRWCVYELERGHHGDVELVSVVDEYDLTPVLRTVARQQEVVDYTDELERSGSIDQQLGQFFQTYCHYNIRREIGGLDDFYDLYMEILVGDGDYHDIETPLIEGIDAPSGTSVNEQLAFAVLLLERLAFLQLLRDRGILDLPAFQKSWREKSRGLNRYTGTYYSKYLKPLFYSVLPHPPADRPTESVETYGQPAQLAGGLFAPLLEEEDTFDVDDAVMQTVLMTFIENESRTLVNEAARSPLIAEFAAAYEGNDIVGRIAPWYSTIEDAYEREVDYVEREIETTLRSYVAE